MCHMLSFHSQFFLKPELHSSQHVPFSCTVATSYYSRQKLNRTAIDKYWHLSESTDQCHGLLMFSYKVFDLVIWNNIWPFPVQVTNFPWDENTPTSSTLSEWLSLIGAHLLVCLFIYCLFSNVVSSSGYIASVIRITNKWRIVIDMQGGGLGLILGIILHFS
jgi:hypothetical protein